MKQLETKNIPESEINVLEMQEKAKKASLYLVGKTIAKMRDISPEIPKSKKNIYRSPYEIDGNVNVKISKGNKIGVNYNERHIPTRFEDYVTRVQRTIKTDLKHKPKRSSLIDVNPKKISLARNSLVHTLENEYDHQKDDLTFREQVRHGSTTVERTVRIPGLYDNPDKSREVITVEQRVYRHGKHVRTRRWESDPDKINSSEDAKEAEVARGIASKIIDRTLETEKLSRQKRKQRDTTIIDRRVKRGEQIAHAKRVSEQRKRNTRT